MSYQPGDTLTLVATDAPTGLTGTISVEVRNATTTLIADATTAIVEEEPRTYIATRPIPGDAVAGVYRAYWDAHDGSDPVVDDTAIVIVAAGTGYMFATVEDLEARLARDFTDDETIQADLLLTLVSGEIIAVAGKTEAWADALSAVPTVLRSIAIEASVRVLNNPGGARSVTEQLGSYSHTASYTDDNAGLLLTREEARRVRRAVHGGEFRTITLASPYSGDSAEDDMDFELS